METLLKIIIPVVGVPTAILMIMRAYFEMETSRIKLTTIKIEKESNKEDKTKTSPQNQNWTSYLSSFDKILLVFFISALLISVVLACVDHRNVIYLGIAFLSVLNTAFWGIYVWLIALTKMLGEINK